MENKTKLRELKGAKIYMAHDLPKDVADRNKMLKNALLCMKDNNVDAKIQKGMLIANGITVSEEQMSQMILEREPKKRVRSEEDNTPPKNWQLDKRSKTGLITAGTSNSKGTQSTTPNTIENFLKYPKNSTNRKGGSYGGKPEEADHLSAFLSAGDGQKQVRKIPLGTELVNTRND